ncbi:MAG: TraR/DksA family transcriptional regulator [Rubrivivax sp.]|nr:TraR/DksA family transcriptional regulator [Rubrivivax sp.]
MSTPLTSGQRALLQAELEQRREVLSRQLAEHQHGQSRVERATEVARQDADDAPQRLPEREIASVLSEHERREIDAVGAALLRLQRDTYGVCTDCGTDIPYDRLKAEPWALRCVACETEHERRRAH